MKQVSVFLSLLVLFTFSCKNELCEKPVTIPSEQVEFVLKMDTLVKQLDSAKNWTRANNYTDLAYTLAFNFDTCNVTWKDMCIDCNFDFTYDENEVYINDLKTSDFEYWLEKDSLLISAQKAMVFETYAFDPDLPTEIMGTYRYYDTLKLATPCPCSQNKLLK